MSTYHAAPASARPGGIDLAAWALVALIVAAVCAAAGWAIGSQGVLGHEDVTRGTALAAQEGLLRGEAVGYRQGATQGRREATLRTRTRIDAERRQAAREGYDAGYVQGRARAGDPDAYAGSTTGTGAYPAAGYEDILAADLFGGDAPGYSDSAYDSYGYGTGVTTPYLDASSSPSSSLAAGW